MDRLRQERRPVRAAITRTCNEVQAELNSGVINNVALRVKLERLEQLLEQIIGLDERVMDALLDDDATEQQLEEETVGSGEYREQISTAKILINDILRPASRPPSPARSEASSYATASVEGGKKRSFKLPKVELKKFNGELKEWLGWWAQFSKIHEDSDLHTTDKFQYLVQAMTPGTRARKLVDSYPQTEENYKKVIDALNDRFGDKTLLTEMYVRELLKLVVSNVGSGKAAKSLGLMHDELETHLRALESLGVTSDQSAAFLYPLVESSLPVELLKVWQRSSASGYDDGDGDKITVDARLKGLMNFLKKEVKGAERLSFVQTGIGELNIQQKGSSKAKRVKDPTEELPTTAGLHVSDQAKCIFCERSHESRDCVKAQSMSLEDRRKTVQAKRSCYTCLRPNHTSKVCKAVVRCVVCGKKHYAIVCPDLASNKPISGSKNIAKETEATNSTLACSSSVILKTLMVTVVGQTATRKVRALIDDGAQRSYVLKTLAEDLGLKVIGSVNLRHTLFGGVGTAVQQHEEFLINVRTGRGHTTTFTVLGQDRICGDIPRVTKGPWVSDLKRKNIWLSDFGEGSPEIGMLIGADIIGKLLTGRIIQLDSGMTAVETRLGWTVMGRIGSHRDSNSLAMTVTNMTVTNFSIEQLWKLETIGIMDPSENKTKQEKEADVWNHFLETVSREKDGRYTVALPWMDGKPVIPNNKMIAERRLESMSRKLKQQNMWEAYDTVFKTWLDLGIIEEVPNEQINNNCHYIPHRAVIKPGSSTTPVRPVFDASCKGDRSPSLNECLEKGPNLLELIPDILLRFREGKIGVTSDITKAFLMVNVHKEDRDFLRFLWWQAPASDKMKIFRHCRVVFGVNCSPFLLAAVIEYHLSNVDPAIKSMAEKLKKSMYVDNCVTSVENLQEYEDFKAKATDLMDKAQMELRLWKRNSVEEFGVGQLISSGCGLNSGRAEDESVLGLKWNTTQDFMYCDMDSSQEPPVKITKRVILSYAHKIFDPIGFVCPVLLFPKKLLQETWSMKIGWDEEVPQEMGKKFMDWCEELGALKKIQIPRNFTGMVSARDCWQLHLFCDASKDAYAAVIFLRTVKGDKVSVNLVQAKSRVAPVKKTSIPRLELLGCCIGVRLLESVKKALELEDVPVFCWSDSTTALAWIYRNDIWGTFVGNRVKEICSLTKSHEWKYVPGTMNPADLPSRGCSPEKLLKSKWWEGPAWLQNESDWPTGMPNPNEDEVAAERKKTSVTAVAINLATLEIPWYAQHFSSYLKNVRVIAWMKRVANKARGKKISGDLTVEEIHEAEKTMIKLIQAEAFPNPQGLVGGIKVVRDSDGILRVVTKLLYRDDSTGFRYPAILPNSHPVVDQLIRHTHKMNGHTGVQFLMSKLRENFWILQGRRRIKMILGSCIICRRFSSKKVSVVPAPLPENRVKTAQVFEVVGIDLAGPLFLKSKEKAWIVLFTCAVYRCVHFELVRAISTEAFLDALSRFISRRGRPSIIYTDNGTNFVGAENLFKLLDWKKINEVTSAQKIKWIFNPPSAAWWGGWWERLVRSMKELLRRILGKATLTYEKLGTYICEVESYINGRPLTTVTEDADDLIALTPAMFLHEIPGSSLVELDFLHASGYQSAYRERKCVLDAFKTRFRNEYLSFLVHRGKEKSQHQFKLGDVVLVEADNKKRWEWPMGRIVELIPGRDGHVRTARVKVAHGILLRPIQRLYPMEISSPEAAPAVPERKQIQETEVRDPELKTRSGRQIKKPDRLGFNDKVN